MAVTLKKGEGVNLRKESGLDLSTVTIGLGWDVAQPKKGFLGGLFAKKAEEYDLDAIAFLRGSDGKVHNLGQRDANGTATLVGGDVIFFNSQRHPSGKIWLTGDNRTGAGDGDDEQIVVKLDEMPAQYASILFIVAIYNAKALNQSFASIENAFIRAVDARGTEICRFNISGDATYARYCSMTFAEVVRDGSGWVFRAIGTPHESDRFVEILKLHV